MPTYEFRCPTGHDFEKFYRSISAAPAEVGCPTCGKIAARQLSAGGGLLFKGSGFYITDYGKDGKKPQATPTAAGDNAKSGGESSASKPDSSGASEKSSSAGSDSGAAVSKPAAESKSGGAASSSATSPKKTKTSE